MFWHVAIGISNLGSDEAPGHVYIHHNVIDNSAYQRGGRPGNYREDTWPVWRIQNPFDSHGAGNKASWWKLYNNTIVTRKSDNEWAAAGPTDVTGNSEKYVYNNIFYMIDDRAVYRDDWASSGSHYDGTVMYKNAPEGLYTFIHFGDGNNYHSLADFRANSGTDWEINGLEIDPGFSVSVIEDPTFDPTTIWERYRPINSQVFTPGASYSELNWPGTEGVNYRGAITFGPWQTFLPISMTQNWGKVSIVPSLDGLSTRYRYADPSLTTSCWPCYLQSDLRVFLHTFVLRPGFMREVQ